jgi:hypothetical protein
MPIKAKRSTLVRFVVPTVAAMAISTTGCSSSDLNPTFTVSENAYHNVVETQFQVTHMVQHGGRVTFTLALSVDNLKSFVGCVTSRPCGGILHIPHQSKTLMRVERFLEEAPHTPG